MVQGYYDADSKRFGPSYTIGDYEAQGQLRDVLLHLKTLVGDLSDVLLDDKDTDFGQLLEASNTCRVNAGVCLGQLSQRLADPMRMHLQQPPPQYMRGVPTMGSPDLHYSSSRSTHSSNGGRFPRTPEQYYQQPSLVAQWQQKKQDPNEQYTPQHIRRDTETSLRESYGNWSGTSQLVTERDVDELSLRRKSSHCLAPEDGALLSPGSLKQSAHKQQALPGEQDLVRESYTSFHLPSGSQSPNRSSNNSSQLGGKEINREDYSPPNFEEHGPFVPDRDSATSATSYASRATYGANHSSLERVPSDFRHSAQPDPLRLPNRVTQQRQFSNGPQAPPPHTPIPTVPFEEFTGHHAINKHTDIPVRLAIHSNGERVNVPPRNGSRHSPSTAGPPQRLLSPGTAGPPFQPSPSVQRALQSQVQKQYNIDRSPQHATQAPNQPPQNETFTVPSTPPQPPCLTTQRQHPQQGSKSYLTQTQNQPQPHQAPPVQAQPPYPAIQREPSSQSPRQLLQQNYPLRQQQQQYQPQYQPPQSPPQSRSQPSPPERTQLLPPSRTQPLSTKAPSVTSSIVPSLPNLPLTLPNEKNTSTFCKGGIRLFLGYSKKSFIQAQKPLGMASFLPYWRCDKCMFEGPMAERPGPLDKKGRPGKAEKVYDPTVRECGAISSAVVGPDGRGEGSGGVRYKWVFLAKCHVPLKSQPDPSGKVDGTKGSFGCIFCIAEGAQRGWSNPSSTPSVGLNGLGLNDAASTFSGKSGQSGSGSANGITPVFGNLQLFMDHLQMHRHEENWPCGEMRGRMKCVVGRVADRNEDWEVNFLPL